jgi:hypothetical protein
MNNAREIMRKAIERANRSLNKYNESMHHDTEVLTGEVSDRTGYDAGNDPEPLKD